LAEESGVELRALEAKLESLESKVLMEKSGMPESMKDLRAQVQGLRAKLEVRRVDHQLGENASCL